MGTALIVTLFIIAIVACLAIIVTIQAWFIMIILGALHASGLENVPTISFFRAFLLVSLAMVVFWLLHVATRDY